MNKLSTEQKAHLTDSLKSYLDKELAIELGDFDAEFLCDHIIEHFAPFFYNQGLSDAQVVLSQKVDFIAEAIDEIALPLPNV